MAGNIYKSKYNRIALFGDTEGIIELLKFVPNDCIACIIGAGIRPQYFDSLCSVSESYNIKLLIQPKISSINYKKFVNQLSRLKIDFILCNSYSMLLSKDILSLVNGKAVNVHYALLPKNRGPNPMQWSLIKGEKQTGVTIHFMDSEFDNGDIIEQTKVNITQRDTWVTLQHKLKRASLNLLRRIIPLLLQDLSKRYKQNESRSSKNYRLDANYPKIDYNRMKDKEIYNLIRAQVYPLKGAYFESHGRRVYLNKKVSLSVIRKLRKKYESS